MGFSTPQFKIVLVGDSSVGKTCLVRKYTNGKFPIKNAATVGVDFVIKHVKVKDDIVNLQLWDTAGQERFRCITQAYYRSAHCLILVYDISSKITFDSLGQWCRDIEQYTNNSDRVYRVLVGNKCDKERVIDYETGEGFAISNGFDMFLETSALQSDNVDKLFNEVAFALYEKKKPNKDDLEKISLSGKKEDSGFRFTCCS